MAMRDQYNRSRRYCRLLLFLFFLLFAFGGQNAFAEQSGKQIITMKAVPISGLDQSLARDFVRGRAFRCQSEPAKNKTYPTFQATDILYGHLTIQDARPPSGQRPPFYFALDKSSGDGDYDLLYMDQNCNDDLTDDPVLKPLKPAPNNFLYGYGGTAQETCFASVKIPCEFGPAGIHPVELIPRLQVRQSGYATLSFVPTTAYRGNFTVAGQAYDIYLGYQFLVGGRFDKAGTALFVIPQGREQIRWWGGDELNATHRFDGKLYRFSCTPRGDQVTLSPYDGPLGTFQLGPGDRDVTKMEMQGSLQSKETSVGIEKEDDATGSKPTDKCRIPTGDYYPYYLTITLDDLQISVSNNYHTEGGRAPRQEPVFGIQVREDKPYILDFSNKPEVMFVQPMKGQRVKPGDELKVEAVLIDPPLDIMLRRLYRVSSTGGQQSLDPKVVIKRADGEVVAEGIMPFG